MRYTVSDAAERAKDIQKGYKFECYIEQLLQEYGLDATRTNVMNPYDPVGARKGYDGGVDIIASYQVPNRTGMPLTFHIQCKNQQNPLTKTAIAEVYAGSKFRMASAYPVVITNTDASVETKQFAKGLSVELILGSDLEYLKWVKLTGHFSYSEYGNLMKILLYKYSTDVGLINSLPNVRNKAYEKSFINQQLKENRAKFNYVQALIEETEKQEQKLIENKKKTVNILKEIVCQNLRICRANHANPPTKKDDTPEIAMEGD